MDESEGCVALGFSNDEYIVALGPPGKLTDELRPLLFTTNIEKAKDFLNSRGAGGPHHDPTGRARFHATDPEIKSDAEPDVEKQEGELNGPAQHLGVVGAGATGQLLA